MGRFYPDLPRQRAATIRRDLAVLVLVVAFAVLGWILYDLVERLTVVAEGVEEAGTTVEGSLRDAADAVDGIPIVGGELADALTGTGEQTGGRVADLGAEGADRIRRTALAVGLVTFLLPAGLVLSVAVPLRVRQVRRLDAARALVGGAEDPERQRLLAMRAAFGLPVDVLLRHTADPVGDLVAGRTGPLLAALAEDVGVRVAGATGTGTRPASRPGGD